MSERSESVADGLRAPIEICDRCGMRARLRVVLDNDGVLCFCSHHALEHHAALEQVARSMEEIPDWTDELGRGGDDGRDDRLVVG
ncbi:MAG TPA: hypothetical protein VFZ37_14555 [Jiangellaceae bacterium]